MFSKKKESKPRKSVVDLSVDEAMALSQIASQVPLGSWTQDMMDAIPPVTPPRRTLQKRRKSQSSPGSRRPSISAPISSSSQDYPSQSSSVKHETSEWAPTTPTGRESGTSHRSQTSPKTPSPRSPPGRQTWARDGHRWRIQQGPLASSPDLATVASQFILGDEQTSPISPPPRARVKADHSSLDSSESSSSPGKSRPASTESGRVVERRTIQSEKPTPHEWIFPRYEDVVIGPRRFKMPIAPSIESQPALSTSTVASSYSSAQKAKSPVREVSSLPRTFAAPMREWEQQAPSRALKEVRKPLLRRGAPSGKRASEGLISQLSAGKDYVAIAGGDDILCDEIRAQSIEDLLKTEPAFLEAFQSPYTSRGLVICGNDREYSGQSVSKVTSILGTIRDGFLRFRHAFHHMKLRYYFLTYIVGRNAELTDKGLVGSVPDMLRSLCVQLLYKLGDELFLDHEYLQNVDINDSYSLLWAFMTLLSAAASRQDPSKDVALANEPFLTPPYREPARFLILIDGINLLEKGTDRPRREFEEFFHEMDELVVKLNEGHHMDCFDPLRREWEAKGLKEEGDHPEDWKQFVKECEMETRFLRQNLVVKYVFIHPQISKWKPRKFGDSVILAAPNPIWI